MKLLKRFAMCLLLVAGQALAGTVPHTWTSTYDPSPDLYVGQTVNFSFDITTGPYGYRPGLDSLNQSTLSLKFNLFDDPSDIVRVCLGTRLCRNVNFPAETAVIDLPGLIVGDNLYTNLTGTETAGSNSSLWLGWNQLANTGKLDVSIYALLGDFTFGDAELKISGNYVPEPGSLALAVAGLGILVGSRRNKRAAN